MAEDLSITFNCPYCGREYDAYSDCRMYDPPRRPRYDGLQATVICRCLSPTTEEPTQLEITLRQKPAGPPGSLINRLLRRPHPTFEWVIEVEVRDWP